MPGVFVKKKYVGDVAANVYSVRVQPETETLVLAGVTNLGSAGTINQANSARVSGSRRRYGTHVRLVRFQFDDAPTGYKKDSPISLPVLSPAFWNILTPGIVGTYLGSPVTYVGKSPEVSK